MNKKKSFFIIPLFFTLLLFACKDESFSLYIEKGSCFGQCPTFSIKLEKNGSFIYSGKRFITPLGEIKGILSEKEKRDVQNWVKDSGILSLSVSKTDSLNATADNVNYSDFPLFTLDIQTNQAHSFRLRGAIPKEFTTLSKNIENLIFPKLEPQK